LEQQKKSQEATMNNSRLLIFFVAAGAMSPAVWGQDAPTTAFPTPESVAILRWYQINQSSAEFSVGQQPAGAAFDGANMWIANYQSGNVTKLRAADGAALGTFRAGGTPSWMTFDGAHMWVNNGSSLIKLRASDGQQLGAFNVGPSPQQMAFDGVSI
jgi:hypothetical protein